MCWKCGNTIDVDGVVSRSLVCNVCGTDVRCCKNCSFYEPGSHYDCHESVDELVSDKERSNFCGFFKLNPNVTTNGKNQQKANNARNAFNNLFGD